MPSPSHLPILLPVPQRMSLGEYRQARVALGDRVKEIGGVYWTTGRWNFHRPLLRYEPIAPADNTSPHPVFGGHQHVVPPGCSCNSTMGFVMLENSPNYSIITASHNRRRLIKAAAQRFAVAPIKDIPRFCDEGHAAYVSFYQRTKYGYRSERTRKAEFAEWARATFSAPKALIFGGYEHSRLLAVSVSYWVHDTIIYTTFFSDTAALEQGIGELMFHALRELASQTPAVRQIFVRPYQGGNGMDQYYLTRGAKVLYKPARLCIHPVASLWLRVFAPTRYSLLVSPPVWPARSADPGSSQAVSSSRVAARRYTLF